MERKHSDEKEIHQLRNRFRDLAEKSFQQGIFTFTGFLGLSEQDIFWQEEGKLSHAGYRLEGGCQAADRVVARFGSPEELGYEVPFPIVCVHIRPLAQKFADDLSHRDFLGALMNLGIERSTIGDIKVGEREAYLFCLDSIAGFICENLSQVRHTHVKCSLTEGPADIPQEEPNPSVSRCSPSGWTRCWRRSITCPGRRAWSCSGRERYTWTAACAGTIPGC